MQLFSMLNGVTLLLKAVAQSIALNCQELTEAISPAYTACRNVSVYVGYRDTALFGGITMLTLGTTFPDFVAEATGVPGGTLSLYNYLGSSWGLFMSHPADFTPVCTTELAQAMKMHEEFKKRDCKLLAYSCNDVETHKKWEEDVVQYAKMSGSLPFPIVADPDRKRAVELGIMDPDEKDKEGLPLTCRAAIVIGPDKRVKAVILYPATVGRSFTEILRLLDALQLAAKYPIATPEGWTPGSEVLVPPNVSSEEAASKLVKGTETQSCPSGKNYLRFTPDPSS